MVRSHTTGMAAEAEFLLFGVGSDPGTPTRLRVQIAEEGSSLRTMTANQKAQIRQMLKEGKGNTFISAHLGVPKSTAWGWVQDVKKEMGLIQTEPSVGGPELSTEESTTLSTEISTVMSDEVAEDTPALIHDQTSCITQVGVVMDPLQQASNREMMMQDELQATSRDCIEVAFKAENVTFNEGLLKEMTQSGPSTVTITHSKPELTFENILSGIKTEHEALVARGERLQSVYNWLDATAGLLGDGVAAQLYLRNTELLGVG